MIEAAITIGLIFGLLAFEIFGLAAGGIIIPGYIALMLSRPEKLLTVLVVSVLTHFIVKKIGQYTFIYGRRQSILCILIGCVLAIFSRNILSIEIGAGIYELQAVGWVIPGLIAYWFGKQGIYKTVSIMTITAVTVRFFIIILFGGELFPY